MTIGKCTKEEFESLRVTVRGYEIWGEPPPGPNKMKFEDLIRDGVIHLSIGELSEPAKQRLANTYLSTCRGWQLRDIHYHGDTDVQLYRLDLAFTQDFDGILKFAARDGTLRTIRKYDEADFDALLASLEPYDLVDPDGADLPLTVHP